MVNKAPADAERPVLRQDAIALLMADHLRVKKLFADFKNLQEDGSDAQKIALVKEICRQLTVHTQIEEEIFYPAVREAIDDDDDMDEALVEHAGAKHLISQLESASPDEDLYDAKVTVLGEQIDHHVMEEEGNMFARARGSGLDLQALGARLEASKAHYLEQGSLDLKNPVALPTKDEDISAKRVSAPPKTPASKPKAPAKKKVAKKQR